MVEHLITVQTPFNSVINLGETVAAIYWKTVEVMVYYVRDIGEEGQIKGVFDAQYRVVTGSNLVWTLI